MSKSNYYEGITLDLALCAAPAGFTRTNSNRWVSLHTADSGEDGTAAEASGSGYARAQYNAGAGWTRTNNSVTNNAEITFGTLSGALGPITHWAIFDASSAGNCLYKGQFGTGRSFLSGDTPKINASGLTITEE
jgi:hypothetical protein